VDDLPGIKAVNIYMPFFGVMLLTLVVWTYMYVRRLTWIATNRPDLALVSTPEKLAQTIPQRVNLPSDNLKNLFEMPILFYAVCLYLSWSGNVDPVHIFCAYAFLVLRVAHSAIHCTLNYVPARFLAYVLSASCLWIMVVRSALQLAGTDI